MGETTSCQAIDDVKILTRIVGQEAEIWRGCRLIGAGMAPVRWVTRSAAHDPLIAAANV